MCQASAKEGKGRCGGRTSVRFMMCQPWFGLQDPDLNKTPSLEAGSQVGGGVQTMAGLAQKAWHWGQEWVGP